MLNSTLFLSLLCMIGLMRLWNPHSSYAGSVDDDDEYQKKHREALHALTQIEIEFAKLRDK